jgi:cobalamin biosynthesis Mg chelatase CobN
MRAAARLLLIIFLTFALAACSTTKKATKEQTQATTEATVSQATATTETAATTTDTALSEQAWADYNVVIDFTRWDFGDAAIVEAADTATHEQGKPPNVSSRPTSITRGTVTITAAGATTKDATTKQEIRNKKKEDTQADANIKTKEQAKEEAKTTTKRDYSSLILALLILAVCTYTAFTIYRNSKK